MNIEFSNEEARALVELIDIAVKGGGLRVAQPAFLLANKIEMAMQAAAMQPQDDEAAK